MAAARPKLPALTTLRFVAAALIVFLHTDTVFGVVDLAAEHSFEQAVSFFFTLSGFILAYNYPTLDGVGRRRFLVARLARLYPGHVTALVILVCVTHFGPPVPTPPHVLQTLATHLALVQSWIPLERFGFSFNPVSWSVSTEFFFYFWFVAILPSWKRRWRSHLAFSFVLAAASIAIAGAFHLPVTAQDTPSLVAVLYVHPFARLVDFVLGMVVAHALQAWGPKVRVGLAAATALEAIALLVPAALMVSTERILRVVFSSGTIWPPPPNSWTLPLVALLHHDLNLVPFALLVFVMALGRGLLSRALALPLFVLLGELSYSIYLLHPSVVYVYQEHARSFRAFPVVVVYLAFWCFLLSTAYLVWALIEVPGRVGIVRWGARFVSPTTSAALPVPATRAVPTSRVPLLVPTRARVGAAAAVVLAGILVLCVSPSGVDRVDAATAASFSKLAIEGTDRVSFGGRFLLHGARLQRGARNVQLELVWESQGPERLDWKVAVHCVDASGTIVAVADYPQDPEGHVVQGGVLWREVAQIPDSKLLPPVSAVAIAVYRGNGPSGEMLATDRGPRDWDNHRIVLPLPLPTTH